MYSGVVPINRLSQPYASYSKQRRVYRLAKGGDVEEQDSQTSTGFNLGTQLVKLGTVLVRGPAKQLSGPSTGTALFSARPVRRDDQTVFVAGATGRLGVRVVRQLLNAGYKVRAGVRNFEKADDFLQIAIKYEIIKGDQIKKLEIVDFDVTLTETITDAIGNAGKVVCAMGANEGSISFATTRAIDGDGTIDLIAAAEDLGVQRFVLVTSLGTGKFGWPAAILNLFGGILQQKRRAERVLEGSKMAFTIVRPGGMERPADNHGDTHNIVFKKRDTKFDGTVSRQQIADVCVAALGIEGGLADNKVIEVIAETTAPEKEWEVLFNEIPAAISQQDKLETIAELEFGEEQIEATEREIAELEEQRLVLQERVRELAPQVKEASASAKEALKFVEQAQAQLQKTQERQQKALLAEKVNQALLKAAQTAQREGRLLSQKEQASIEKSILDPPTEAEQAAKVDSKVAPKVAEKATPAKKEVVARKVPLPSKAAAPPAKAAKPVEKAQEKPDVAVAEKNVSIDEEFAAARKRIQEAEAQAKKQKAEQLRQERVAFQKKQAETVKAMEDEKKKRLDERKKLEEEAAKMAKATAPTLKATPPPPPPPPAKPTPEILANKKEAAEWIAAWKVRAGKAAPPKVPAVKAEAPKVPAGVKAVPRPVAKPAPKIQIAAIAATSKKEIEANKKEAQAWIAAWKARAAAEPAKAEAKAPPPPAAAPTIQKLEASKKEDKSWIPGLKPRKVEVAAPKVVAKATTKSNPAEIQINKREAQEWIAAWKERKDEPAAPTAPTAPPASDTSSSETSASDIQANKAEAQAWIAAWKVRAGIAPEEEKSEGIAGFFANLNPFQPTKATPQKKAQNEGVKQVGKEAGQKVAKSEGSNGIVEGNGAVPPNVQEAREWIRKWKVRTLEAGIPEKTNAVKK